MSFCHGSSHSFISMSCLANTGCIAVSLLSDRIPGPGVEIPALDFVWVQHIPLYTP
ncbi:hypothetical protein [Methanoregula sp.]|uniref:hypothetical protein n=1 Tax=Methanoregula sp. TaxID=2052170 RepID=UPI00342F8A80